MKPLNESAAKLAARPLHGESEPDNGSGFQILGISAFSAAAGVIGAIIGGIIEGDALGALHICILAAITAFYSCSMCQISATDFAMGKDFVTALRYTNGLKDRLVWWLSRTYLCLRTQVSL